MTCRDLTCAVSLSPPQGLWPGVGEKVEVKKCLGDLGWQWCHGVCTGLDEANGRFRMRVSHPVWWRGRLIVAKGDEVWYLIAVGWRHRVDDPDNPDVSIWPKHDRFVVAVEESLATIAERYRISSRFKPFQAVSSCWSA